MIAIAAFIAGLVIGGVLVFVWALLSAGRDIERMHDDWLP